MDKVFLVIAELWVEQQKAFQDSCNIHLLASEGKTKRFLFVGNLLLSRNHHRFWQNYMPFGRLCKGSQIPRSSSARGEN